jgi:hypothetical protein
MIKKKKKFCVGATLLSLMEGQRLRIFKDIVLMRIFGPKREEVTGGWRKLCIS